MTQRTLLGLFLLPLCAFLAPSTAQAGGYANAFYGSQRGHAVTPTPLALYYNPAALAATERVHLALDVTLALHKQEYTRTATTVPEPADAKGANLGTSKGFDVLSAPTLAGSMKFGDFAVGAGFFVPLGGFARWQGNDAFKGNQNYPGAQDGPARWFLTEGALMSMYFTAGASYTDQASRLSFGAGINAIYSLVDYTRAQTTGFDDSLVLFNEGRGHIDVNGWDASFSVGAMWEAIEDQLWIGASYQAPPGFYQGMKLSGARRLSVGGTTSRQEVDLHQSMADIVRWAFRYKPSSRYELRLFGDYENWSRFDKQCLTVKGKSCKLGPNGSADETEVVSNIPTDFRDTASVHLGGSYWFMPEWEGFLGVGYDSNAIPNAALNPVVLDGHDIFATLGGRVLLGSKAALLLSYTHMQMLNRSAKTNLDQYDRPSRRPTAAGDYKQWTGIFDALVEVYFQ